MKVITISSRNQIVIPSAVRAKLKIGSGDKLIVERVTDTEVILKKALSYYDFLGIAKLHKKDPVQRVREMRNTWRRINRRES